MDLFLNDLIFDMDMHYQNYISCFTAILFLFIFMALSGPYSKKLEDIKTNIVIGLGLFCIATMLSFLGLNLSFPPTYQLPGYTVSYRLLNNDIVIGEDTYFDSGVRDLNHQIIYKSSGQKFYYIECSRDKKVVPGKECWEFAKKTPIKELIGMSSNVDNMVVSK